MSELRSEDPFPSTIWSQIRGGDDEAARARSFEALAAGYEGPIRVWLRAALTRDEDEARERSQDFFVWVAESGFLQKADPRLGRFRAFLKTALRNFVRDRRRAEAAQKRGGGRRPLSLDGGDEPQGLGPVADPAAATPESLLDRAWRAALVTRAVGRLEQRLREAGKAPAFAVFRDYYLEPQPGVDYATLAERHGIDRVAVSNALARTKKLYRRELERQVLESVQSPEDYEEELRWLFGDEAGSRGRP